MRKKISTKTSYGWSLSSHYNNTEGQRRIAIADSWANGSIDERNQGLIRCVCTHQNHGQSENPKEQECSRHLNERKRKRGRYEFLQLMKGTDKVTDESHELQTFIDMPWSLLQNSGALFAWHQHLWSKRECLSDSYLQDISGFLLRR